jgi:hypothetical protein
VFESRTPPKGSATFFSAPGYEEFAWDYNANKWLPIYEKQMEITYIRLSDTEGSLGYTSTKNFNDKTFYRWKGVSISTKTQLFENGNFRNDVIDFREIDRIDILDVDPPVQFYKDPKGEFRPCYFDPRHSRIFVWKNVTTPESQVPKKSAQHRWPILEDGKPAGLKLKIYEIDTPEHLLPLVKQWIVKPTETKPAESKPATSK